MQLFRIVEEPGRDLLALPQVLASLQCFIFGYSHILIALRRDIMSILAQKVWAFLGLGVSKRNYAHMNILSWYVSTSPPQTYNVS
jgi:Mn2+/Fe2+ NRAMP family transporter